MPAAKPASKPQTITEIKLTKDPIPLDLHNKVQEKLTSARVTLLFKHPFFGNLSTRLKLMPADSWLHTAAVDGRYFYYNHQFIDMLGTDELLFLFGHEVLHLVYDHLGRREGREALVVDQEGKPHSLHNIAADYVVNLELVKSNIGKLITTVPALYDTKYDGWASEAVYDYLYDQAKKNTQNKMRSGQGGQGFAGMEDMAGKGFDEHLDPTKDPNSGKDKNGNADGSGPVGMTESERKQMRDEMREAVLNAAQQAGAGNLPAGVQRMVKDLEDPQMDWRSLLRAQLESTVVNDFTFMRPSRTAWDLDAILPGLVSDPKLRIAVAIDMSGSISEEMARDFISECVGIMAQFPNYEIYVMTFDTQVYNPVVFSSENGEDITDYKIHGGGGTMFECVWEHLKNESEWSANEPPMRLVLFTDGLPCSSWGDPDYCETVFILHGTETIQPPFGQFAYYPKDERARR